MFSKVLTRHTRRPLTATRLLTTTRKTAFSTEAENDYAPWEQSRILLTGC
jgi:hypothetical protein